MRPWSLRRDNQNGLLRKRPNEKEKYDETHS